LNTCLFRTISYLTAVDVHAIGSILSLYLINVCKNESYFPIDFYNFFVLPIK